MITIMTMVTAMKEEKMNMKADMDIVTAMTATVMGKTGTDIVMDTRKR